MVLSHLTLGSGLNIQVDTETRSSPRSLAMSRYGIPSDSQETRGLMSDKPPKATMSKLPVDDIETGTFPSNYEQTHQTAIRNALIRKVYGILSVQLLVSLAFITLVSYNAGFKSFMLAQPGILYLTMIGSFAIILVLVCFDSAAKTHPTNLMLLAAFTLCESYLLAFITTAYETHIVFQAVIITAAIVMGLTLYAFDTKRDFTSCGPYLFVCLLVLVFGGLLRLFLPASPMFETMWACFGALVFSFYIIFDTQLLISKAQPDQYIFVALNLYLDIINLFIYILRLLGDRK
jgi:FtsH-binding integral membrane protein